MHTQPLPELLTCGHYSQLPIGGTGAAGYATINGRKVCYACADDLQRDELTRDRACFAYLSGDMKTVTTWTGGKLATITRLTSARTGFPDATGRRPVRYYFQATDVHGQIWRGTSPGGGMYARMRRSK